MGPRSRDSGCGRRGRSLSASGCIAEGTQFAQHLVEFALSAVAAG
jgi:hypothetical protein